MTLSRRTFLKSSSALAASAAFATRVAAAPAAEAITPALIEAAKKEGKVVWYTSIDLSVAEKIAKSFEAKFPGIAVRVERSGAERVFQRIGQEYSSKIHAVDVANSSDAAHFIAWKRDGWLAPYVPEDVAKFYPPEHRDPDGLFASFRITLSSIAYNTRLVKADDALAYANQWDGAYMASFEPSDIASLKRLHQIAKAAGVVKNEPPDSAFATEPWERAKNIK